MNLLRAYQIITEAMLDNYYSFKALNPDKAITTHLFTIGNHDLNISSGLFERVISDLQKIGAIHEENRSYFPAMVGDEFAYDKDGFHIYETEFQDVLYNIVDFKILRDKYIDVNELIAGNEKVLNTMEENKSVYQILVDLEGFKCRADGSVTYLNTPLEYSRQDKIILTILLQNHSAVVNYEALKDALGNEQISNDNINKYISRINNNLEEILGYKPIKSERGIGQRLQFI